MMDWIKLAVPKILILVGAVFITFGLVGSFQWGQNLKIPVQNFWTRALFVIFGLIFVIAGFLQYKKEHNESKKVKVTGSQEKPERPLNASSLEVPKKVQSGTYEDFLKTCDTYLKIFEGRFCREYSADIVLSPVSGRPELLLVEIRYRYEKKVQDSKLKFKITRIRSETAKGKQLSNDGYECNFILDEKDIKSPAPEMLYAIKHLSVKSKDLAKHLIRRLSDDGLAIEYEVVIPTDIPSDKPVHFDFGVSFPMERETFLVIDFDLPTDGFNITFDYVRIGDSLEVISQSFISSRFGPNEITRPGSKSPSLIQLVHEGWLLPKNGVVFCWWNKQSNET